MLGLLQGVFDVLLAQIGAVQGLADGVVDLPGAGAPVGHAAHQSTLGDGGVVRIHHQVNLIRMRGVGEAGLDDLRLVFAAGDVDQESRSRLGVLGGGVDPNGVGEDHVGGLASRRLGQGDGLPVHVGIVLAHVVDHPAALVGHPHQFLADGLTAPASTHVGRGDQRAVFVHAHHELSRAHHLRAVHRPLGEGVVGVRATGAEGEGREASPVGVLAEAGVVGVGGDGLGCRLQVVPGPVGGRLVNAGLCEDFR